MGATDEIQDIPEKLRKYKDELTLLFKSYEVSSLQSLISIHKSNQQFRDEWSEIWTKVAKDEGGKLSLTTIGALIGLALGGVGIAAGGGAIGVPLALILGLGGFLSGSMFDAFSFFGEKKPIKTKVKKHLHNRIKEDSDAAGLSVAEYTERIIGQAYSDDHAVMVSSDTPAKLTAEALAMFNETPACSIVCSRREEIDAKVVELKATIAEQQNVLKAIKFGDNNTCSIKCSRSAQMEARIAELEAENNALYEVIQRVYDNEQDG